MHCVTERHQRYEPTIFRFCQLPSPHFLCCNTDWAFCRFSRGCPWSIIDLRQTPKKCNKSVPFSSPNALYETTTHKKIQIIFHDFVLTFVNFILLPPLCLEEWFARSTLLVDFTLILGGWADGLFFASSLFERLSKRAGLKVHIKQVSKKDKNRETLRDRSIKTD